MTPRLTTDFWVSAYLAQLRHEDIPAFITQKGDATAGDILIKLNSLNGQARCYQRRFSLTRDGQFWAVLCEGAEAEVDAEIESQKGFDPDLWVIEVEDKSGRHGLEVEP